MNTRDRDENPTPEIVYMVPGMGVDPRGALRGLYRADPSIRTTVDEVCAQIDDVGGAHGFEPVGAVLLDSRRPPVPGERAPFYAYAASAAVFRVLADLGVRPDCVIGQSFGEIGAQLCSGLLTVAEGALAAAAVLDAAKIAAPGPGGMVVLRASQTQTHELLARLARPELAIALINAPDETIVSGPAEAIDALLAQNDHDGEDPFRRARLDVPHAYHHPALAPVAERFRGALEVLPRRSLSCRQISAIRRRAYTDTDDTRDRLADPVTNTVHFLEAVRQLPPRERRFVEIGIGANLSRCVRTIHPAARTFAPLARSASPLDTLHELAA